MEDSIKGQEYRNLVAKMNRKLPFCPQINNVCQLHNCICFIAEDFGAYEDNANNNVDKTGRPYCSLFKRSFDDWVQMKK